MLRSLPRIAAAAIALAGPAAGLLLGGSTPAAAAANANAGPGFPAHYAAPYLETWNSPSVMADARSATGLKYFTLAFVISDGSCNATFNGTANGTQVQLYDCNGTGAQQWQQGSGGRLVNPQSGRCLDATGPSSANGTRLQIWDCTGAANQQWTLSA